MTRLRIDPPKQVAETYTNAITTINPRKATPNFHNLFVTFAKFYEEGGVSQSAEPDLGSARRVLEKGTKTPFRTVEELADLWCEWSEFELRNEYVACDDFTTCSKTLLFITGTMMRLYE